MAAGSLRKLDLGLDQRSAVFFFYGRRRLLRVHKVAPDSSAVEFSRFQLLKQVNRVRNIESAGTGGKKLA